MSTSPTLDELIDSKELRDKEKLRCEEITKRFLQMELDKLSNIGKITVVITLMASIIRACPDKHFRHIVVQAFEIGLGTVMKEFEK